MSISKITNGVEFLLKYVLVIGISSSVTCLLRFLVHFSIGFRIFKFFCQLLCYRYLLSVGLSFDVFEFINPSFYVIYFFMSCSINSSLIQGLTHILLHCLLKLLSSVVKSLIHQELIFVYGAL